VIAGVPSSSNEAGPEALAWHCCIHGRADDAHGATALPTGLATALAFDDVVLSSAESKTIQNSQKSYWGTA
jgi:hypothetical protein